MVRPRIVILGLGYVGLPLAVVFSKHYEVIGLDQNEQKIQELEAAQDRMGEVSTEDLEQANIKYTSNPSVIGEADYVIVAVPTPIDAKNKPNLEPLKQATKTIAKHLNKGTTVVYESTVYPGVTEDECIPLLEQSGLKLNKDFYVGYSPERVNPGDKHHTIDKIVKIVSGSNKETTDKLETLYGKIITAGIHKTKDIKTAEAAKVIENVQRDLNIALMNELAVLFDKMNIDVHDVIEAAGTKWNFNKFTPGLVGGHCIGVDPYYLTFKAQELGLNPDLILAARSINDNMHKHYTKKLLEELEKKGIPPNKAKIGVLGLTFKENCSDFRNSRAKQLIQELVNKGVTTYGIDPWLEENTIKEFNAIPKTLEELDTLNLDGIIITVPHKEFKELQTNTIPVVIRVKKAPSPTD